MEEETKKEKKVERKDVHIIVPEPARAGVRVEK